LRAAGFRLDVIYPADEPHTALLSGDAGSLRLTRPGAAPLPSGLPAFAPDFILTKAGAAAGQGRAGMLYRDLIPGRLDGRYIASHIAIPDGGPVADWVHYHRIALQLIVVRKGWVRVVYQDQGEPFVMNEGDMVLQPPGIRHRVLESSSGLEVVEVTAPALHETFADHDLILPNAKREVGLFGGQRFLFHQASLTPWTSFNGAEAQESEMREATDGLAQVRIIRPASTAELRFAPHDGELVFGFVLDGTAKLDHGGEFDLAATDSFVIPPDESWALRAMSKDFRLLHVATGRLDAAA
jgi:mannose-6-phosphate isomerase-like protein (cupin superfamily)